MSKALCPVLAAAVVLLFAASLLIGPASLGPLTGLRGLFAGGEDATVIIMRDIRLPRAILGLLVGASLGLSGAALQGFLRNPLAEPGIIGVSSTASLGAVIVFYSGMAGASVFALVVMGKVEAAEYLALGASGLAALGVHAAVTRKQPDNPPGN